MQSPGSLQRGDTSELGIMGLEEGKLIKSSGSTVFHVLSWLCFTGFGGSVAFLDTLSCGSLLLACSPQDPRFWCSLLSNCCAISSSGSMSFGLGFGV